MSWTIGNFYLTTEQMQGNAREVLSFFEQKGWSLNAIAGICGNMQSESNINPGIWQSLQEGNYSGGFGLVQWTPATNYTNWAGANGYGITDPNGQLTWIDSVTVSLLWSSIFVTLMANKIGGLQFGIYRNCQISSRVFHTAVAALPLTKANRSDFE